MKDRLTVIDIFRLFFESKTQTEKYYYIHNYDIERMLIEFGKTYGYLHTAETYVRAFREIRSNNLLKDSFIITEEKIPGKRTKVFKITRVK